MMIAKIMYYTFVTKLSSIVEKKNHNKYMLKYFKSDKSNEEQDSKMLYWLFLAPQAIVQTNKKEVHIDYG